MTTATLFIQGVGLCGPGLADWDSAAKLLGGTLPYTRTPTAIPPPARLPAAERRRAGTAIKIAIAVADEACRQAGLDPARAATIFASSSGDGTNCHALCEALATPERLVSPTRFTNSVHNAAAGYWHIAVSGRAASTSVCAFDTGFAAGLVEAIGQLHQQPQPLLLVASDVPYPEPLHAARPLVDSLGVALVLHAAADGALARLSVTAQADDVATPCSDEALETVRRQIPAARALPLLELLARGRAGRIVLECQPGMSLRVDVQPL